VKLAKFLGRNLKNRVIILDEPSTGLHPKDLKGLISILDRFASNGTTVIVVEHNTDLIRAADWVIDLGPSAGPRGGEIVYMGSLKGLYAASSKTKDALAGEKKLEPRQQKGEKKQFSKKITVAGGKVNNLKNIDVEIPKNKITIVTGLSGSGKSSLVNGILVAEAERRYLETLSLYERQGIREGKEAVVDSVKGLGVTLTVTPERKLYGRRANIGVSTEINHHLAALMSSLGEQTCPDCGLKMNRNDKWECPNCGITKSHATPRMFDPTNYRAACTTCHGVGSLQTPRPEKLIIDASKPLCGGAMYSPGFFPQGYLCKPGNGGYDIIQAFASRHGFEPERTPWQTIPKQVQDMFYHGDPEPITVTFRSKSGRTNTRTITFKGFYGWIRDWDIGGTYTDNVECPSCKGSKLRREHLTVKINGLNIHELQEKSLTELYQAMNEVNLEKNHPSRYNLEIVKRRLTFLIQVGLGYVNLNRVSASLSAGEAQRVKLAGILGSGITSLTIILDEPSRGLHPSEVAMLIDALKELRDNGNTVVIVEHDIQLVKEGDHIIDMGPGSGVQGGEIIAQGPPDRIVKSNTPTGRWLAQKKSTINRDHVRTPSEWMVIKGARQYNLKGENIRIPLGVLVGVCGVSGSGKSTLVTDTIGRTLSPIKHTTSVAREPLMPGVHDAILNPPENVIILDQTKTSIRSPAAYLNLRARLHKIFAETPDAVAKGLTEKELGKPCSVCNGRGEVRTNMGFLPDIYSLCETCDGTGYSSEAWTVKIKGHSLPELNNLTLNQVYELFKDRKNIAKPLETAKQVGLGYLTLHQPGHSLSGGEAQRLKIVKELSKKTREKTLYILDEPSLGQHMDDITRLAEILQKIVNQGHSVILVEHHPHLLAATDYLIELGPKGGLEGGYVVAKGTPEEFIQIQSPTSPYLRNVLRSRQ
jgi:excinuclease ABC subunit A